MPADSPNGSAHLTGHRLRNANLRKRSLARAEQAPPLAQAMVRIRADMMGMTRLEFTRRSGIPRGTLRDAELGVHLPTRRILQRFLAFCRKQGVAADQLEKLCRLYTGPIDSLGGWLSALQLQAGSPRELARRVGISPATLWEYRRGNFPLPLSLLLRLGKAVGVDPTPAEEIWRKAERQRLLDRGYPEALAEFWVLCSRKNYAEKHLLDLGLGTAAARRLRYLELPAWSRMVKAARAICDDEKELDRLKRLWLRDEQEQQGRPFDPFGARVKKLRQQQGIRRRDLADLFGVGGKKPARIIKAIEEDGFYSARAHPAGLAGMLADVDEQPRLLERWRQRRRQFHRRHRPETRIELRLAREMYGFEISDMERVLGYSSQEYQKIERGVTPLRDTANDRILQAIHDAGKVRLADLHRAWKARLDQRLAWQDPPSVAGMIALLARREGGLIPLARCLDKAGLKDMGKTRLRTIMQGRKVPPWPVLLRVARACGVADLSEVKHDWMERYRAELQKRGASPLAVEVRALIAEVDPTVRAFSGRLGLNQSVLVRNLQAIDRDAPVRWKSVERILLAAGIPADHIRWREIRALWYTSEARRPRSSVNGKAERRSPW
ncbi:MAG: hypothetical protein FJ271_30650 [Planctomycetes bacterium]|nr:hypothetical protein [Planctomycetota bacterium]